MKVSSEQNKLSENEKEGLVVKPSFLTPFNVTVTYYRNSIKLFYIHTKVYYKGKFDVNSNIYSDNWKVYNELVNFKEKKHYLFDLDNNEFVIGQSHINEIGGFYAINYFN
jgi:hypothetical protein